MPNTCAQEHRKARPPPLSMETGLFGTEACFLVGSEIENRGQDLVKDVLSAI